MKTKKDSSRNAKAVGRTDRYLYLQIVIEVVRICKSPAPNRRTDLILFRYGADIYTYNIACCLLDTNKTV